MSLLNFKKQFNQNSEFIHFNNSGQAPIPEVYRDKAVNWLDRFYREGASCSMEGWGQVEVTRKKLAAYIGCQTEELSFFQTTASAISQAALSIPLSPGDEILTWDQEYPSNFYPWRIAAEKAGAKVIQVSSIDYKTPAEAILKSVTTKTKVIAISWVQFMTGAVTDLKKISSALANQDIWLVADIIQGVGVKPFNFVESGFDIVCCGSHKWLCSGYGAAFWAIKSERCEQLIPLEYGAMTFGNPDTPKSFSIPMKKTAIKFEPGSKAMIEIIAMGETLDLFNKTGIESINFEACRLADLLRTGLNNLNVKNFLPHEGCIVSFSAGSADKDLKIATALAENKISYAVRGPGIRLSLHAFNTDEEVNKALKVISTLN